MAAPIEITRVAAHVEANSKGWGPGNNPDEWKVVVSLSDTPNKAWAEAWRAEVDQLRDTAPDLYMGNWEYKPEDQRIEIWVTEASAENFVPQLDRALARANARCAEMIERGNLSRASQQERAEEERAEAARLQARLDSL